MSVDFIKVKDLDYLEKEVLINKITESDNGTEIVKAKMNELENNKDHKFWQKLKMKGSIILVRRVITEKNKDQNLA